MIKPLIALSLCVLSAMAMASSSQLEVTNALSGNTIIGTWDGRNYRQYFHAKGWTLYKEDGKPSSRGAWRIANNGHFCSRWPPQLGESCYEAIVKDNQVVWRGVESGDEQPPALIEKGRHLMP